MLPVSKNSSSELDQKKFKPIDRKNSLNSLSFNSVLQPSQHSHHRIWLILMILSIQILVLFTFRYFSNPTSVYYQRRQNFPAPNSADATPDYFAETPSYSNLTDSKDSDDCRSGRIFVYDIPRTFNQEILASCDDLNPWNSRCDALSNNGLGRRAESLAGIVPENLVPAWYWTDQFVTEILFHNRIQNHKCRVVEPQSATAFYIPFYAGLAVGKYLWSNSSAKERDELCTRMLTWIRDQPYFKRSNGWDHFTTMGRITWDFRRSDDHDWGSSCIYMPGMRNVTRLLIERNPWDYFDVGVPYPTGFHPRSQSDIDTWQTFVRSRKRTNLFCFAGATRGAIRNDFREILLNHCRQESDSCRLVDCGGARCLNGTSAILETFLSTDFCLQPRGDSFSRRSIFDCMVAGSIPVFFWKRTAYYQYEWFLPNEPGSYSVFIDRNGVKNGTISIRSVLESYSKEEVKKMREKVIEFLPKFVYAEPKEGLENVKDAVDIAVEGVLRRFEEQEEWGFKW